MDRNDVTYFNRNEPFSVVNKVTPHWTQRGCMVFITWRLKDSLPIQTIKLIENEIDRLVALSREKNSQELEADAEWIGMLPRSIIGWKTFHIYEKYVDAGLGSCLLKVPSLRQVVVESLLKFDKERYYMSDFVIMPNHLHMLVAFPDEESLLKQPECWKRYTGRRINQLLGRKGDFWMPGQFDHLVRSEKQFEYLREYIAMNAVIAKLRPDEFYHYSKG